MTPPLSTKRMRLEPISPDDQDFVFEGLSHPEVIAFYGVSYASFEATRTQMEWYKKLEKENTGLAWKMVGKKGERMGVICVYNYQREHRKTEVGFWLLPSYWGHGYCGEALLEVMNYCKEAMQLIRMEAFVETGNEASGKLLQRCGFELEGTMRCCERKGDRWISLQVWANLFEPC